MKFKYDITGLDCPNCAAKLSNLFSNIEGVDSAKINFLTEKLTVESTLDADKLYKTLADTAKKFDKAVRIEQ